jgi:trigger factor
MEVQLKEIEYCKVSANYKADLEAITNKQNEALKQLRKLAIPGFRAGKAPDFAIKNHFKTKIDEWVKVELIKQGFDDVLFETKIKPIGRPDCVAANLGEFTFDCTFEIMKKPDFDLKEYKGLEIPKPAEDHTQAEVAEQMLQDLRLRHADLVPYSETDFVKVGDQITMDFEITVDGQPLPNGKAEGQLYTLTQNNSVFPELDSNLLGMNAGQTREFDVVLPEFFNDNKGKPAHIKATVHMGTVSVPAPLDDELAKKEGFDSLAELRMKIDGVASFKLKQTELGKVADQLSKQLIAKNEMVLPDYLVKMEAEMSANMYGKKWDDLSDVEKEEFMGRADKSVRLSLILNAVQEAEPECVLSDNETVEAIKVRLQEMGVQDIEGQFNQMQANGQLLGLAASLKNEFTVQWLVKQAKIIEE